MNSKVVSKREWVEARLALLKKEKEYSRLRDELTKERLALPWVLVEKDYTFKSEQGLIHFSELFGDKSQLIVQHFMFQEDWEAGCKSCSFMADHINPALTHLAEKTSLSPRFPLLRFHSSSGISNVWSGTFSGCRPQSLSLIETSMCLSTTVN
nr:DUF899 family protein [Vibrio sp. RE88]